MELGFRKIESRQGREKRRQSLWKREIVMFHFHLHLHLHSTVLSFFILFFI